MLDRTDAARILVVDDEPGITQALKRALEGSGFEVECAGDAGEGLRMFQESNFDLVISDYQMKDMNGVQMLAEMASLRPAIPRILLTGFADLEVAKSSINEGRVHAFLTKPWDDAMLLLSVEQVLQTRKLYAENVELRNALFLEKLSAAIGVAANVRQIMKTSLNHLSDEFNFRFGSAYLTDPIDRKKLTKIGGVWTNSGFPALSDLNRQVEDLLGAAISERVPQVVKAFLNGDNESSAPPAAVEVAIPLMFGNNAVGALYFLQSGASIAQVNIHFELFKTVGSYIGMAIENARLRAHSIEQEKMAAIGSAMACLSHDIRNILTPIVTGTELLQEKIRDEKNLNLSNTCKIISNGAGHLMDIVGEMLDFTKPAIPRLGSCDVIKLVEELCTEVRMMAAGKSIEVKLKLHAQSIEMKLDSDHIHRSLMNIARNGIEAMEAGGTLSIETQEVAPPFSMILSGSAQSPALHKALQISITDTGGGIPPEELSKIFTPFFTTKKSKGTGLGLVIAKQITEDHGGLIHVDSEPSKGTTFKVFLPFTPHVADVCASQDLSAASR